MSPQPPNESRVRAALQQYPGLDPNAVIAVARTEGLGGGIGDQGSSFGPFQLHQHGGAYPSWAPQNPSAAQAWAWSPTGLNYALNRINTVASGLHGGSAIANIVKRFERPADPTSEIARAASYLGVPVPAGTNALFPGVAPSGGTGAAGGAAPSNTNAFAALISSLMNDQQQVQAPYATTSAPTFSAPQPTDQGVAANNYQLMQQALLSRLGGSSYGQ